MPLNLIRNPYSKPILAMLLMVLTFTAYAGKPKPKLKLVKLSCKTCQINGGTTATVGSASFYTLVGGTTAGWTVSNGATILNSTSTQLEVQFNNTGITNIETAGATCGGASINVTVTVAPLTSPTISTSTGTINYGATPGVISSSGSSGGSCGTSYTYAWYSSPNNSTWTQISGATGLSYQPGALTQTTYYKQVVTCSGSTATSNILTITVYPQLTGGSISPSSQAINYNTTPSGLTLSGVSGGSGSYTYQWQSSSSSSFTSPTNVGSGGTTYSPGALTATTYYRVAVTSNGVTTYSSTATVTVYPQLSGGVVNAHLQQIYYNTAPSTLTLSSVTGGNGTYSYQWISSPTISFSTFTNVGTNTTTYSPPALTSSTYYRVIVTSNGATGNSTSASVLVYAQLQSGTITPASQTINYNTVPSALTVSAASGSDGTYTYQWQSSSDNSTWGNISGQTSTSYSPPALTATTYYRVVTTDNGVSVNSASATVTVYAQLAGGSISPSSQSINYNTTPSTMTLSGVSGGNGSYTYQWQSSPNSSFSSPTNVGSGSTTYSPGALTSTTYYRVAVTSNGVTTYSSIAEDSVYAQLTGGSISPASQTINYNSTPSTMTLSGVSGGNGSYTYQWQSSPNSSFSSPTNVGSGTTTYSPGALTSTTYYRVAVTSNGATTYSNIAEDSVYAQLTGGSISPASQTINYNSTPSTMTLSGVSGGNGTYTYQWQSSPNSSFSSPTNVGSGSTTYSPGALTSTTYYRVAVTSNGVTTYSSIAEDSVYAQLAPGTISPASQSIDNGDYPATLTLSGVTGGNGSYTYQWMSSPNNSSWTAISGQTGTSYSPSAISSTTYYEVVVTSNGASANSSVATITVYPTLQPGTISPGFQLIMPNTVPSSLTLKGTSGGNGTYTYQWQWSTDLSTWMDLSGQTGTTYSPPALTQLTFFQVVVTSNGDNATTSFAYVNVYPPLQGGSVSPATQSINYNTAPAPIIINDDASGGDKNYTYQWQSSPDNSTWSNISGQTGKSYFPPALTTTTYYRVTVLDRGTSAYSASATVNVYPALQPGSLTPTSQTITSGTPATISLSGTSGGNGTYTYQWQSSYDNGSWTNVNGQTGTTYAPPLLSPGVYYRVAVTSNGATAYTNTANVTVTEPLNGGAITGPTGTIGYNTSPGTLGSAQDAYGGSCFPGDYRYQWQYSSDGANFFNLPGATGSSYTPTTPMTTSLYFRRQVTCGTNTTNSNTIYVQVASGPQSNCSAPKQ